MAEEHSSDASDAPTLPQGTPAPPRNDDATVTTPMRNTPVTLPAGATPPTMTAAAIGGQAVELVIGTQFGQYRIEAGLGQGGMGVVYRGIDVQLERTVALKVMRPELAADPHFKERFLREAKTAASVMHPNVVTLFAAGEQAGCLYMAFEFVAGGDVDVRIKRGGPLPVPDALRIIAECAQGLDAIHEAGLVHRDIKPHNIFLDDKGRAKLGDLGLARQTGGDDRLTMTGVGLGTPAYMSPEQALGQADVDIRSDIHALGATLYAMLGGEAPFDGNSPFAVTNAVINGDRPSVRARNPAVSAQVEAVILRAMARDRKQRYATPQALFAAVAGLDEMATVYGGSASGLAAVAAPASGATPVTVLANPAPSQGMNHSPGPQPPRPRRWGSIFGLVAVVLALGGGLSLSLRGGGSVPDTAAAPDQRLARGPAPAAPAGEPVDLVAEDAGAPTVAASAPAASASVPMPSAPPDPADQARVDLAALGDPSRLRPAGVATASAAVVALAALAPKDPAVASWRANIERVEAQVQLAQAEAEALARAEAEREAAAQREAQAQAQAVAERQALARRVEAERQTEAKRVADAKRAADAKRLAEAQAQSELPAAHGPVARIRTAIKDSAYVQALSLYQSHAGDPAVRAIQPELERAVLPWARRAVSAERWQQVLAALPSSAAATEAAAVIAGLASIGLTGPSETIRHAVGSRALSEVIAEAKDGALILLAGGVYALDGLDIKRPVFIVGDHAVRLSFAGRRGLVLRTEFMVLSGVSIVAGSPDAGPREALTVKSGRPVISACTVEAPVATGMLVAGRRTAPTVIDVEIRGAGRRGLHLDGNAGLWQRCRIADSGEQGVYFESGGEAELVACSIVNNKGGGVQTYNAGEGTLRDCMVQANGAYGLRVTDGSRIHFLGGEVTGSPKGGASVEDGSELTIERARLHANAQANAEVADGGELTLTDCTVEGGPQLGVAVRSGGELTGTGGAVVANPLVGIRVEDGGRVTLDGVSLRANGVALHAARGARGSVTGLRFETNLQRDVQRDEGSRIDGLP